MKRAPTKLGPRRAPKNSTIAKVAKTPAAAAKRGRRSVNLTISAEVIEAAKALRLNASKAAEAGIAEAVRKAREKEWLEGAGPAIDAYNERVGKHGPALGLPDWAK